MRIEQRIIVDCYSHTTGVTCRVCEVWQHKEYCVLSLSPLVRDLTLIRVGMIKVDMFAAIAIGYITSSCHSGSRSDCGSNMAAPPLGRTMHRSSRSLNRREQATVSLLVWANSSGWDQSARQCSSHSKYDKLLFLECRDSLTKKLHGKYTGIAHQSLTQPRYLTDPLGFRWSSSP